MRTPTIEQLANPDQAAVSALLSEAFAADPSYDYFLDGCTPTEKERYRARLVRFIVAYHCQSGLPVWGVTQQGVLVACALLEEPAPAWRRVLALFWQLPKLIGQVPFSSVQRMNRYAMVSRQGLPKGIGYYLIKIGVSPNHQGQGLGKSLITAVLNHYHNADEILALDTENPANVPLYQHLGFQLHDQQMLDKLCIYRLYRPLK